MEPVFKQALKAGRVGSVTDTCINCISSNFSLTNILKEDNLGVLYNTGVYNNIGQNMGGGDLQSYTI